MHDQGRIISFGPFASRPLPLTLRAFTLIELLVVVAIIALLVAILLPSLNLAREQAKRTVCASHMKQMAISFHMYQYDFTLLPHSVSSGVRAPVVAVSLTARPVPSTAVLPALPRSCTATITRLRSCTPSLVA